MAEQTQEAKVHCDPTRRHDFVLIFEVTDGNPNGDPDAGNLPRTDPETMQGLVTDVALKRKIRNFVEVVSEDHEHSERLKIFVEHHGVLNDQIRRAYTEQGMEVGRRTERAVTAPAVVENLRGTSEALPGAFKFTDVPDESEEQPRLAYSGELSDAEFKAALDSLGDDFAPETKKLLADLKKESDKAGKPKKSRDDVEKARRWMCDNFFDVRMFGAVMGTGLNAGQVRGPVQLTFARSVDPIIPQDLAITRMAVTDERDRDKLQTIGRKTLIPYGLYVGYGFYSAHFGAGKNGTGVTESDLELFWEALVHMWDFDRSAGRGLMGPRGLYVFTHNRKLGNAPVQDLFGLIAAGLKTEGSSPRKFSDYTVEVRDDLPEGVTLTRLVG